MKTLILLSLAIFIGCGSDSPITNSPVPPSSSDTVLLFSRDSIYTGTLFSTRDSVSDTISFQIDTLYGSFTLSSENAKTIYAYVNSFEINRAYSVSPGDEDFTFTLPVNQSNYVVKIYLQIVEALSSSYRASLRNIRLWYVN